MFDAHETQKHLLREIRRVSAIPHPLGKETAQPPAVTAGDLGNEAMAGLFLQKLPSRLLLKNGTSGGSKSGPQPKVATSQAQYFFGLPRSQLYQ